MISLNKLILLYYLFSNYTSALDNGLARTPPMGWLSWAQFGCKTNCTKYPNDCISDKLIRRTADAMVSKGYLKAGYKYVTIDDCWLARKRNADGRLQPHPERFLYGMKNLSDYIHSKGLLFGIYEDIGTHTCAGYPGLLNNFEIDAKTFAEWEVDYIKVDGCYIPHNGTMIDNYIKFGEFLNKTGRSMVYSCSWPAYMKIQNAEYDLLPKTCNLWRNSWDIGSTWGSIKGIVGWFSKNQDAIAKFAGPGHWNDPDMLIIGNGKLTVGQSRAQMALWAILAAPLLMSADLDLMEPTHQAILLNEDVIGINQDELGIQGLLLKKVSNDTDLWVRAITPVLNGFHSYAIAFVNKNKRVNPDKVKTTLSSIGLQDTNSYFVCNIFKSQSKPRLIRITHTFTVQTDPQDVQLFKAIPATPTMLKCKNRLTCSKFHKDDIENICQDTTF